MRPLPMRMRLTAWHLTVILASFALYSIAVYVGLRKAIEDTVDSQLRIRSDNIAQFLESASPQQDATVPRLLPKSSGLGPGDDLYQVSTGPGSVLYQSPAMHELEVPLDPARLRAHYRHRRDQGNYTTYYHRQGDVRVLSSTLQIANEEYHVQVATIVSPLYEVLEAFSLWAGTGLPLVLCAAGIGGYWLSGRAMKPVRDLVLATREISERNLSSRLEVPAARDELRELAETMNAMLARLEMAFTRVTRFTSDASHELRTPIAVIRTTSEVLLEQERAPAQYQEMVRQILRESEFTSALIEQLLTLARADADTAQLSLEPMDLRGLIEEILPGARTLAEGQEIVWSTDLPAHAIVVLGSRSHLRRLLMILIDNAVRYTAAGGQIRLRLEQVGEDALIEVVDAGIGIPAEELAHIFDRFFRASNARFFNPEGTGLGLSIASWIAAAHGAKLTAHSVAGSGTSMRVRIRVEAQ